MATLTPPLSELLPRWLAEQRWYTGKGRVPVLSRTGGIRLQDPAGQVGLEIHLLTDSAGTEPVLYQVPVTARSQPVEALHTALIGTTEHSELGTRYLYDGTADPVFVQALLDLVHSGGTLTSDDGPSGGQATGHPVEPASAAPRPVVKRSAVLSGEQSNTSVIVDLDGVSGAGQRAPAPLIVKIFRVLHGGDNPDVAVQSALAEAGSTLVPLPMGYVAGTWPAVDAGAASGEPISGHLAFVQEFMPGVRDAWRTALDAAREDRDFTEPARTLGRATASVHATLRDAFGQTTLDEAGRTELVDRMRTRHQAAVAAVPGLAEHGAAITEVYDAVAAEPLPTAQRIHGDYHLGQVLDVSGRGWVLVDFEGEPLRPLAERVLPDLVLRDVAGMLRSFDYAAGSVGQEDDLDRAAWADAARTAFLDGYAEGGADPRDRQALLDALELDKALYEVVYESRNRPAWVSIPVAAITRLLARRRGSTGSVGQPLTETSAGPDESAAGAPALAADAAVTPPADGHAGAADQPASEPARRPDRAPLDPAQVGQLLRGLHGNPHAVLGAHPHDGGVTVRALRPLASSVTLVTPEGRVPMEHEMHGLWTAVLAQDSVPDYRFDVEWGDGVQHRQDDPYRYLPTLGEIDRHLLLEGRHEQLWEVLGSRIRVYDGPMGHVWGTSLRRLGAERARRARRRGLQPVGQLGAPDAHPRRVRGVGAVHPRGGRGQPLQVRGDRTGRHAHPQGRPDGTAERGAAELGLDRQLQQARVAGRRVDDGAGCPRPALPADVGLRGAPGQLAAGRLLPRPGRPAGQLRAPAGLHARGVHAGDAAPLRPVLGLPRHRLLRR